MKRTNGRAANQLRPVEIVRRYTKFAPGSVLVSVGDTRVLCTASIDERPPRFMQDQGAHGRGWVTAEYSMLPGSTQERSQREASRGRPSGRTQEIQRLIGRSLRAVTDLSAIGERTIWLDCDVLQADGGTRTASITGACIALMDACAKVRAKSQNAAPFPLEDFVAATSVGIVDGEPILDLCYAEDSSADVDANVVMTGSGAFVEIQATAEHAAFTREQSDAMLDLAAVGIHELIRLQKLLIQEDRVAVRSGDA